VRKHGAGSCVISERGSTCIQEMKHAHVESVMALGVPFAAPGGLFDFQSQDITKRVREYIPVMLKLRLTVGAGGWRDARTRGRGVAHFLMQPPPPETYSLHRKLSGAFLLCTRLGARVPCRSILEQYHSLYWKWRHSPTGEAAAAAESHAV
jgi:aarF domain-containing kinase